MELGEIFILGNIFELWLLPEDSADPPISVENRLYLRPLVKSVTRCFLIVLLQEHKVRTAIQIVVAERTKDKI